MGKIYISPSGLTEVQSLVSSQSEKMRDLENTVAQVLLNLDMKVSSTENIRQSLLTIKTEAAKQSGLLHDMDVALLQAIDAFEAADKTIANEARDVSYGADSIGTRNWGDVGTSAIQYATHTLPIITSVLGPFNLVGCELFDPSTGKLSQWVESAFNGVSASSLAMLAGNDVDFMDFMDKFKSNVGSAESAAKAWELFAGTDSAKQLYEGLKEVGESDFFKVTDGLEDMKKIMDAVDAGDSDVVEELIKEYVTGTASEVTGTSGIYLDLGWNMGKNLAESVRDFADNPTIGNLFHGVWTTVGKGYFDTGAGLAESAIDGISDVIGMDFDKEDFGEAMDYLWNHPVESLAATGEVIWDGLKKAGSWIKFW